MIQNKTLLLLLLAILVISCNQTTPSSPPKECIIGNQTWMAENLDVETFRNGDPILFAETDKEWLDALEKKIPAWTYLVHSDKFDKYGKLYNWYAVNDPRGLAPKGWHIPSKEEWQDLVHRYQKQNKIKDLISTQGWSGFTHIRELENINLNGTNKSGFNALPGGYVTQRINDEGKEYTYFPGEGILSSWWTTTLFSTNNAFSTTIQSYESMMDNQIYQEIYFEISDIRAGKSIRCIKGELPKSEAINKSAANSTEVKIGEQIWMSKNLNVDRFSNGDIIPEAKSKKDWQNAIVQMKPVWCYSDNITNTGDYIGKLYNWAAVNDPRGLAPKGWRIANSADWEKLSSFIGQDTKRLVSSQRDLYTYKERLGTSPDNGFSAFSSYIRITDSGFAFYGFFWWTSDKKVVLFDGGYSGPFTINIFPMDSSKEGDGRPVRCIKILN